MLTLNTNNPITPALSHHGSHGGFAVARNEQDEAVCYVSYATIESDFVIVSFGVNPRVPVAEVNIGADAIDRELEAEAHKYAIKRLLIVYPNRDVAEVVRTYALQPFTMGRIGQHINPITHLN
jgi:hypothetical protein